MPGDDQNPQMKPEKPRGNVPINDLGLFHSRAFPGFDPPALWVGSGLKKLKKKHGREKNLRGKGVGGGESLALKFTEKK